MSHKKTVSAEAISAILLAERNTFETNVLPEHHNWKLNLRDECFNRDFSREFRNNYWLVKFSLFYILI